ncbi:hypothetical protein [Streptomyces phaeochromogenes]
MSHLKSSVRRDNSDRVERRARELRAEAAALVDPLRRALPVVQIERPKQIADLAQDVFRGAMVVRLLAQRDIYSDTVPVQSVRDEHQRLAGAITAYTTGARNYLNGPSLEVS